MIICIIGLVLIFLLFSVYMLSIIADKKTDYYHDKIRDIHNRQKTFGETLLDAPALDYYSKKQDMWEKFDIRGCYQTDVMFGLFSAMIVSILVLMFAGFKSQGGKDYKEYLLLEETIEYCIDNDIDIDNSLLEKSIKINKEISKHKQDKQNPWLSWFVYNDICNVDGIDLNKFQGR